MPLKVFKIIDVGDISAGGTVEKTYTAEDDYIIKRMYIVETTETPVGLQYITFTFWVDNVPYTKDKVNAKLFEGYTNQVPELNIDFSRGKTFRISLTNNHSSSTIKVQVILELWSP